MTYGLTGWLSGIGVTLYRALFYPTLFWVTLHLVKRVTTFFSLWPGIGSEDSQFELGWVTLGWYTTKLNKIFRWLGQHPYLSKFFAVWFNVGVIFGLIGMASSVLLLIYNLYHTLAVPKEVHPLTPIVS